MVSKVERSGYSLLNESWSMLLTYATAIVLVFVLTFHLLLHSPLTGQSLDATLLFPAPKQNLESFQVIFGLLLYAAVIHGFNGVRVIALEWFHPRNRVWLLNLVIVALMAFFLALGSYTLLVVG
jgi:succinate dehydrogenase hydrophobic anchor subunit